MAWLFSNTTIILIGGKAGSGKSVTADIIYGYLREYDGSLYVVRESFSSLVKEIAWRFFGWDGRKDERGRRLLQEIGGLGRRYDENIWVNSLINRIEENYNVPPNVVIVDDWRFSNEYDVLSKKFKVYTIIIESSRNRLNYPKDILNDKSETSLPNTADILIVNNTDNIDEYKKMVKHLVNEYIIEKERR